MKLVKQLALLLGASAVTFGVIVVSIIVYQYTAMEPELPHEDDCELIDLVQTADSSAEVHHYFCQRGDKKQWQGHELWLHEPLEDKWQRMMTTQSPSCLQLQLDNKTLSIAHNGDRMEMNLAEPVFLYRDSAGQSVSLAVDIDRANDAQCAPEKMRP